MKNSLAWRVACVAGLLGVALGAFGAHGLKPVLQQNGTQAVWEKAVLYHFIHAIALLVLARLKPVPRFAWSCLAAGIVLFSGSLYALAVTNQTWLGAITPIGGTAFIVGWVCLAWHPPKDP
ncbi:MAG TPA: DUF423 domain-containing protein [Verrucomicrobiae bacterium]